jgi:hypothetical protein
MVRIIQQSLSASGVVSGLNSVIQPKSTTTLTFTQLYIGRAQVKA